MSAYEIRHRRISEGEGDYIRDRRVGEYQHCVHSWQRFYVIVANGRRIDSFLTKAAAMKKLRVLQRGAAA